jgi:hypothetical protein
MQIPAGASRQGSAEKSTDGEQLPGGPSRTCAAIKIHREDPRKIILWARNHHPLVSSDTPSWCALTAIAPAVRFNSFAIRATPAFFFASDFSSRTSDDVHARLTVAFFAGVFFADVFFLAMSAPQFGSRACITPAFSKATHVVDELIFAKTLSAVQQSVGLPLRRTLRSRHHPAGDLPHMFSGIRKLTSQEFRLNLDGLLKIGGMNQLSRMLECGPHVLLGEGQRLLGNFGSGTRNRRHRLVCGIEKHPERLFRLIDSFFSQIAQFGRDFQFRFNHVAILPFGSGANHISATASLPYLALRPPRLLFRRREKRPRLTAARDKNSSTVGDATLGAGVRSGNLNNPIFRT